VIDANSGTNSIVSGRYVEFYLNSHIAIQGTAKPCKYALVYDEIGFKLSELELLTYWSCYLYARCNRSVSLATPAYYAHWASKRARTLSSAGGSSADLIAVSNEWAKVGRHSTMFFI
jgi:eukaryotic translation initiation factor 2C